MKTLGPRIQVCWYTGKYPNHNELDNRIVSTKFEAYALIDSHSILTQRKWGESYNYRIVDLLNRFKPIFIES